jgi:hypothetical protein
MALLLLEAFAIEVLHRRQLRDPEKPRARGLK